MYESNTKDKQVQQSNSFLKVKHSFTQNSDTESNDNTNYLNKNPFTTEKGDLDNYNEKETQVIKKQNINCQICKVKDSIYKCPRCQIKTCCLACVKEHKRIYKCTGVRDKFSKKSLKDFTDNDYIRDLNFINSTINETNRIGRKVFDLTEENPTDVVHIYNSSKVNSGISGIAVKNEIEDNLDSTGTNDKSGKSQGEDLNERKEKGGFETKTEETKSFVKDGN